MNTKIARWMVLGLWVTGLAHAAFTPPTQDQLKEAAQEPPKVMALVKDASVDQAAEVGRDVIIAVVGLDLKPKDRDARIVDVITYLFRAFPDNTLKLAIALGKVVAASPTASMSPAIVSAVQQSIIFVASLDVGNAFGNAYNLSLQTVAGAPGGGKSVPAQPPPPPVALPYEGQRLR